MVVRIKLSNVSGFGNADSPANRMLREMRRLFKPNPLNDRELLIGEAKVELSDGFGDHTVFIKSIDAMSKGQGHGSAALARVIELATQYHVDLRLHSVPFGDGGLLKDDLDAWYMRRSFVRQKDDHYLRRWGQKEIGKVIADQISPSILRVTAFHGTNRCFDSFDEKYFGSRDTGYLGKGFYFSTSLQCAASYAEGPNARLLKCELTLKNPCEVHSFGTADYRSLFHSSDIREELLRDGYDSVLCAHHPQYADDAASVEIVALHANQIEIVENLEPELAFRRRGESIEDFEERLQSYGGTGAELWEIMEKHRKTKQTMITSFHNGLVDVAPNV